MKQIYFLTTILFLSFINLNAQTTDVVTVGLNHPIELLLNGNDLYIAHVNKISKIDITATNPTVTDVVGGGLFTPIGLLLIGNDLYIAESGGGKITKIDITISNPTVTDVITGLSRPTSLALNGNELYISESSAGKISKIDITASNPIATDVITGLNDPRGLALNGNDLYIAEVLGNKISKIDITLSSPTATDVVSINNVFSLHLNGNNLYASSDSSVYKVDISMTTPIATSIVNSLFVPRGLALNGNDLYIAELQNDKIIKFNTTTLGIDIFKNENDNTNIYPNPSNNFIQISGFNNARIYTVYNNLGYKVKSGSINKNKKISIQNLANGLYFMKFDNGYTLKFIKE
ncbi:MAG: T9SS type A sorting domain-containing protein [Flavobacteriaceae bacterium]